jgi:isochorismate synthase
MEEVLGYKFSTIQKRSFSRYFESCRTQGFGCALYRLPQSNTRHLVIDLAGGHDIEKTQIETLKSGYVFHPFSSERHPVKFLNEDVHLIRDQNEMEVKIVKSVVSEEEFTDSFENPGQSEGGPALDYSPEKMDTEHPPEKDAYLSLVKKTIGEIRNEKFQKAVVSRVKTIELPSDFDVVRFFDILCDRYTNAFIHVTFIPEAGLWVGATPEVLIQIDKNNQFQTMALAATQAYNKDIDLEDTTWSQKDIEEQALVSRYIINCFKKIRLREFEEIGPRTYLSGNLVHLRTEYLVDLNQVPFPELGTIMLELLHPTSAVCGMPKESTLDFLHKNEGFDRSYFSGYLGPVNIFDETNIYVNLRTMKVMSPYANLYAGAGIIANSNPEKEWIETEIKMETLLSVLREI